MIGVLKEPASRGGSEAMHRLERGATVQISEPRNLFPLVDGSDHVILVAGGIGITPLLSMVEQLSYDSSSFELHYCARSVGRLAFANRLREGRFDGRVHMHLDNAPASRFNAAATFAGHRTDNTHIYVCGPAGFIDHVLGAARTAGYAERQLHREYFGAVEGSDKKNVPFEIEISSTGQRITVGADETVVEALARIGITIPTSCEQGVCGTCLTRVRSGIPMHRDMFLTDEEHKVNDQFTPCCSRSQSPCLTIDL